MTVRGAPRRLLSTLLLALGVTAPPAARAAAQQWVTETRDPKQTMDDDFAKAYAEWTGKPIYGSPLVDHLPKVAGIPSPKDVLGYHIGAPAKLTYYADILRYYRALAAATPRVRVETIGRSDENRELVVVWVSSDANMAKLQQNRDNLKRIADPRGLTDVQVKEIIGSTKPHYHLMGGLHSGETGPPEMQMELVYRLATETSPYISQIRDNVIVSVTPVADADGRDRIIDWFYRGREITADSAATAGREGRPAAAAPDSAAPAPGADTTAVGGGGGRAGGAPATIGVPYWGKYVYHDNNRDINLSQVSMRALADWYFTAHPPIMHDLHESLALLYTYSGAAPQNPNLDPLLFAELPFFANWELSQMTKWGMPGVYTHAFMDGWSPGYLGSIAYNHNGMMRMYETQSGRDPVAAAAVVAAGATEAPAAGRGGRAAAGGRGGRGRGGARPAPAPAPAAAANAGGRGGSAAADSTATPGGGRAGGVGGAGGAGGGRAGGPAIPTGRGGGQDREWYRGIQVPTGMPASFTRRNNTNYMQTGVLSALQLTAMFPNLVLENFYVKTRNSIAVGRAVAPYGYVIPAQLDMTRAAELVNILRIQGIEVGQTTASIRVGTDTFPAGSYVIKGGQPYWRLAKNLLEKQRFPDPALRTYDDSGWSMGFAFNVDVKEIRDSSVLNVAAPLVTRAEARGRVIANGNAGMAVAHHGSNNMITFRYRLRDTPMQVAEQSFKVGDVDFPAGSFIIAGGGANMQAARAAVESLGLTAAALTALPTVPMHAADLPRVAIYSQWTGTQELGWYRHAFDKFGIPFELIYKERVQKGKLKADYDVILMAYQNINRQAVMAKPAARPAAYGPNDKYKFLGMYGTSPDMSGGFGMEGVRAFEEFLESSGTLIAAHNAIRFPIEFGFARTADLDQITGLNAQRPLVQATITRPEHPVFYGYGKTTIPIKYVSGPVLRVGIADSANVLGRYVGGDSAILSGLMVGADLIKDRPFAVDIPNAHNGKGRVLLFANNPIYRWQNHGEFNMVFNSIVNWNDVPPRK